MGGAKEGQNALVKIADSVPEAAKKKLDEIKEGMKAGNFEVFTGPIAVLLTARNCSPWNTRKLTQAWKDKVDFYAKGVEGNIPSGQESGAHWVTVSPLQPMVCFPEVQLIMRKVEKQI